MMFKLYTWKDVERKVKLFLSKNNIPYVNDIEVYTSEIVVLLNDENETAQIRDLLIKIFGTNYDVENKLLFLDQSELTLAVTIEFEEKMKKNAKVLPLFRSVVFNERSYEKEVLEKALPEECPVIAFHSYKGGVGRTLSLLAFLKAWSANRPEDRLLIVDSDIEAPGITWLANQENDIEEAVSYLDLLELIQADMLNDEIMKDVAENIRNSTIKIETEERIVEHMIVPTYRYVEQLLDIYSNPESIARGFKNKYLLAEILSGLGKATGASAVLVDLRAGISEFSAPLLFDIRVKKYIVTSTSFQSVQGTKMLLNQVCKGVTLEENQIMPEILLSMVPEGLDTVNIKSDLLREYNVDEKNSSYTDNLITELPFASELIHLTSLNQIMKNLTGRDFYVNINKLVTDRFIIQDTQKENINDRENVINAINQLAGKQIVAEGNEEFSVLLTKAIENLLKRFSVNIPQAVILGAKGSGKTFLFREFIRKKTWEEFKKINHFVPLRKEVTYILPLLASSNSGDFSDIMNDAIQEATRGTSCVKYNPGCWNDNKKEVERYNKNEHDRMEWECFWKNIILKSFFDETELSEVDLKLQQEKRRVVFLVDGLEEIFEKTLENENEKNAIIALVREMMEEFKTKYKNLGIFIFLRKDLASNSISTNYEQFESPYKSFALSWSHSEALRLALWLVEQAVPNFYQGEMALEQASQEVIERNLTRLWGLKLGKSKSNEAYSSRWILAALSDFNSQLQARDIIRFLKKATDNIGKAVYNDRYIMPAEIKNAVQECSTEKIREIKDEIAALEPILETLEQALPEQRILPFDADTFKWSQQQEKLLKQEGLLKIDNDKYYLPEIVRHALKFKYAKGARPKVLSLLLK